MSIRPAVIALALVVALAPQVMAQKQKAQRRDPSVIRADEIEQHLTKNVYDLISAVRSRWLIRRGNSSVQLGSQGGVVYLDGVRWGGIEELRNIGADRIREARFLSASDATTRYGTGHPDGAIEVLSKEGSTRR